MPAANCGPGSSMVWGLTSGGTDPTVLSTSDRFLLNNVEAAHEEEKNRCGRNDDGPRKRAAGRRRSDSTSESPEQVDSPTKSDDTCMSSLSSEYDSYSGPSASSTSSTSSFDDGGLAPLPRTRCSSVPSLLADVQLKSPISRLYEASRARGLNILFAERNRAGLPHRMHFTMSVTVGEIKMEAEGPTKKTCKERAAEKALPLVMELPVLYPRRTHSSQPIRSASQSGSEKISKEEEEEMSSSCSSTGSADQQPSFGPKPVTSSAITRGTVQLRGGKHPVMLLQEVAMQHKWPVPTYTLLSTHSVVCSSNDGQRYSRLHFVLIVAAFGLEYKGHGNDKKSAKLNAAEGMLRLLGISDGKTTSPTPNGSCTPACGVPNLHAQHRRESLPRQNSQNEQSRHVLPQLARHTLPQLARNTMFNLRGLMDQSHANGAQNLPWQAAHLPQQRLMNRMWMDIRKHALLQGQGQVNCPTEDRGALKILERLVSKHGYRASVLDLAKSAQGVYSAFVSINCNPVIFKRGSGMSASDARNDAIEQALQAFLQQQATAIATTRGGAPNQQSFNAATAPGSGHGRIDDTPTHRSRTHSLPTGLSSMSAGAHLPASVRYQPTQSKSSGPAPGLVRVSSSGAIGHAQYAWEQQKSMPGSREQYSSVSHRHHGDHHNTEFGFSRRQPPSGAGDSNPTSWNAICPTLHDSECSCSECSSTFSQPIHNGQQKSVPAPSFGSYKENSTLPKYRFMRSNSVGGSSSLRPKGVWSNGWSSTDLLPEVSTVMTSSPVYESTSEGNISAPSWPWCVGADDPDDAFIAQHLDSLGLMDRPADFDGLPSSKSDNLPIGSGRHFDPPQSMGAQEKHAAPMAPFAPFSDAGITKTSPSRPSLGNQSSTSSLSDAVNMAVSAQISSIYPPPTRSDASCAGDAAIYENCTSSFPGLPESALGEVYTKSIW